MKPGRESTRKPVFEMWLKPMRLVDLTPSEIVLAVQTTFARDWVENRLKAEITLVLHELLGAEIALRVVVDPGTGTETPATAVAPAAKLAPADDLRVGHLNARYTFDDFVIGNSNRFAHAASQAVAEAPAMAYNPLFLYGGVGLGKTHLLHAIGQHVASNKKSARVAYLSSEKFTNEYIDGIQNNQLAKFRKKYRQTDVLLIDDIQFLAGKERIQEEFFHTFNALHEAHKQIVLTCDRPASEIQNLEQRLVSRFEWGLVTDMQPPDIETRLAILRKKAEMMAVTLPEDIFNFLANRIRTNIRRLEGALIRVASYASLTGKKLTLEVVEGLLREVLHEEGRFSVNIETIQKKVADHYDIRLADMTSKRRPENIAFPRQIAMFLARQMTESSLNTIGESFGGRDHGTVLHACRLVKDRMEVDANVRQVVSYLEKQLLR